MTAVKLLRTFHPGEADDRAKEVFLVNKGRCQGKGISVRGIQKRLEHYAREAGLKVSCHQLRHTMATQLLIPSSYLVTIKTSWVILNKNHPALLPGLQHQSAAWSCTGPWWWSWKELLMERYERRFYPPEPVPGRVACSDELIRAHSRRRLCLRLLYREIRLPGR